MSGTFGFTGGRILAMDPTIGEPEVVIIEDGRIEATGAKELLAAHENAEIVDLAGATLVPGFIDAHHHLSLAAMHPAYVNLTDVTDLDTLAARLRDHAANHEGAWIRACGWDDLTTGVRINRRDLDELGLDRPIVIAHFSYHQAVVCSRALELLEIGPGTPDPPGGRIDRLPDGAPSGLLQERAWSEAHARTLADYADPDRWPARIEERARELLKAGITAVHDAACPPAAEEAYVVLARDGRLPLSVLVMPHPAGILSEPDVRRLDGPPTGEGDERLRVGPLKLFADGGVAFAMEVTVGGQRVSGGMLLPGLDEAVRGAAERGWQVAVHSQGNVGLRAATDAFRSALHGRDLDHRWRVEHAMLAGPAEIEGLREVGAVAVVQPGFVDHVGVLVEGLQPDEHRWMPFGSLRDAGVPIAASSDDPCAYSEPLLTSGRGATRITGSGRPLHPEEAVTYEDWLRAYTIGAAYAGRQEGERGSLTPGKRADLVVLEGDLDPEGPPEVAQTWVAGERVY